MQDYILKLPKTELHLHIEGTLEPALMLKLAQRNGIRLPFKSMQEIQQAYQFQNLQSFLNLYYQGSNVLITEQDFYDLTYAYLKKVHSQTVRHTEIFFDPQTHTQRGIKFSTVINGIHHALVDGQKHFNITSKLILCFLRDLSEESALATLQQALPYKSWLTGVGLDSAEMGNPPAKFERVFTKALDHGLFTVAHAGEEGFTDYIWQALKLLKVSRIDHGIKCIHDPYLVEHLVKYQIPLTVCPISNVKLRIFPSLEKHPIKHMLAMGICVTINSDDPAYFTSHILENFIATQQALNLNREEIFKIASNAVMATFLPDDDKKNLLHELSSYHHNSKHLSQNANYKN